MERIKLQNLVFSEENSELYFHEKEDELYADGYFNLLDIAKRKKYTNIKDVILHVKATGYSSVTIMHDKEEVGEYLIGADWIFEEKSTEDMENRDCVRNATELVLPYDRYDSGVFWVRFNADGDKKDEHSTHRQIEAAFYGVVESKRDTGICIGMCTYKREEYVRKNVSQVKKIMASSEEVSRHLSMYIIDNGNTIKSEDIGIDSGNESFDIRVFSNKNAGGASGFTRAMIEAIRNREKKNFTHILLMDDDVRVMEDLFVRLYGVLCSLKDEYKDIRIGGELFRKEFPWILNSRGEWSERYLTESADHLKNLRNLDTCFEVIGRKVNDKRLYSGWWCACYALDMIERTSLPLPIFIHDDDISFEKEHAENRIIFLNGISVWHNGFEFSNYGVNQYYHIRNKLIGSSLYEPDINAAKAAKWVLKCMVALLISYRYKEIEYIAQAVKDFVKGPEWLRSLDSEKLNSKLRIQFKADSMTEDVFDNKDIQKYRDDFSPDMLLQYSQEDRMSGHMKNKITLNGWILPAKYDCVEMTLLDSPFKAYRARKIILFDPMERKSVVLEKDYRKFFNSIVYLMGTFVSAVCSYDKTSEQYREKKLWLTSRKSWEEYLGI